MGVFRISRIAATVRSVIGPGLALALMLCTPPALSEPAFRFVTVGADLDNPLIEDIVQDQQGFIWFTTPDELVRYDGYGLLRFRHDSADDGSLSDGRLVALATDSKGGLLVSVGSGIDRLDLESGKFGRLLPPSDDRKQITNLLVDDDGIVWAGTFGSGLLKIDQAAGTVEQLIPVAQADDGPQPAYIYALFEDSRKKLWVGTAGGLYSLDHDGRSFTYHRNPGKPPRFPPEHMDVQAIAETKGDRLWIGTFLGPYLFDDLSGEFRALPNWLDRYEEGEWKRESQGIPAIHIDSEGHVWFMSDRRGIDIYDPQTRSYLNVPADPEGKFGLSDQAVTSFLEDRDGVLWIGTAAGLNRLDSRTMRFDWLREDPEGNRGPSTNDINSVYQDPQGVVWVGTQNGLERRDAQTGRWSRYQVEPGSDPSRPPFNWTFGIDEDDLGRLWVGTPGKINLFDRKAGTFESWVIQQRVDFIQDDGTGKLWSSYDGAGLARFDPATGEEQYFFEGFTAEPPADGHEPYRYQPFCRYRQPNGTIWFGTSEGLKRWQPDSADDLEDVAVPGLGESGGEPPWIMRILPAEEGRFYLQTRTRVLVYDPAGGTATPLTGFPESDEIWLIDTTLDLKGRLWVGTNKGLLLFDPGDRDSYLYSRQDGVPNDRIVHGGLITEQDGRILAATKEGLVEFDPADFPEVHGTPAVAISGLWIDNERSPSLDLGSAGPQHNGAGVELGYQDYTIRLQLAALDFADPDRNRYQYRLEGLEDDWITVDPGQRSATYTTLPPGRYTFRAGAANMDGVWNEAGIALPITVLPPPWRTWWAYMIYLIAAVLLVTSIIAARTRAARRRAAELEVEVDNRTREINQQRETIAEQASRLERVLDTKNKLFADLSHEFRTPLTLISGPLTEAFAQADDPEMHEKLDMANRSANRLGRLVDQLLDLARIDAGQPVSRDPQPLGAIVDSQVRAFRPLAEKRGIVLEAGRIENRWVACGADALEKILSNLMSNAVKFTPENGQVVVSVEGAADDLVMVEIRDTGVGIPKILQAEIFERFQRGIEQGERVPGAGIGLALARELAEGCGGRIELDSEPGRGTTVRVFLPETEEPEARADGEPAPGDTTRQELRTLEPEADLGSATAGEGLGPLVLIIEDSSELRAYLPMVLGSSFQCVGAPDGEAGLEIARDAIPDMVICDAMLPGIDGFDVCRILKGDERTSHVPVLMLTARADDASRMKGFERQADDYLTKPFSNEELRVRVGNLIRSRETMRRHFGRQLFLEAGETVELADPDKAFLDKLEKVVGRLYQESETSAADIAREMAMSLRQLQRKIKALTNYTPVEYLRNFRLAKGKALIEAGMSSGRAAFEVGFTSQSYFARCFRALYGESPSEARGDNGET